MKSQRQKVSEDEEDSSEHIPVELMIEILSRLSAKDIARCRRVSKLWASILFRTDFTETFFTKSYSRPKLLFACWEEDSKLHLLSTHQPNIPNENPFPPPIAASYHMSLDFDNSCKVISPINGLVCVGDDRILKKRKTPMISNPSTGHSVSLPRMKTRRRTGATSFVGYDPVEKQLKVLSMIYDHGIVKEHQVLTLQSGKLSWRLIDCGITIPHNHGWLSICIDGVLYYNASPYKSSEDPMIICFDVRSEKFSFIKVAQPCKRAVRCGATWINYKGKLGSILAVGDYKFRGTNRYIEMWVLEDPKRMEWSKQVFKMPPIWKLAAEDAVLTCVGMTSSNEIVFSQSYTYQPFYVFFYNIESKVVKRVQILGLEPFPRHMIRTFVNHVENVKAF